MTASTTKTESPRPTLSVVVPIFNEETVLPTFHSALRAVLDAMQEEVEVVYVDDGSTDATGDVVRRIQAEDDRVVVVDLSRNFGHQAALTAGLDVASGQAVLTMDGDLEHPPEAIPDFLAMWRKGAEVVFGVRRIAQRAGLLKRITSRTYYWVFSHIADIDIAVDAPDFRLMDRRAVNAMRSMRERARFLRGMARWVGFRQAHVEYEPGVRAGGEPGYSLFKMLRFGADGILSFSKMPIRITSLTGIGVSIGAFLYAGVATYEHYVLDRTVPGWTSTIVVLSLLAGAQLLGLGMVGEYVGYVFDEVKRRPIYIAREVVRPAGRRLEPPGEAAETDEEHPAD